MKAIGRTISVGCLLLVFSLFLCTSCGGGDDDNNAGTTVCFNCAGTSGITLIQCKLQNAQIKGCENL